MQLIFSFQFILVRLVFSKCREDERSIQIFLNPLFFSVEEAKIILQLHVKEGCKCDSEIRIKDCTNMYLMYHSGRLLKEGWMAPPSSGAHGLLPLCTAAVHRPHCYEYYKLRL